MRFKTVQGWMVAIGCAIAVSAHGFAQTIPGAPPTPQTAPVPTPTLVPLPPGSLPTTTAPKALFSDEPLIFEQLDREVTLSADGLGTDQSTIVALLQTEAAVKTFSVINMPFASATQHVEIDYIRVRHPDGTVVETPASDALEMPTEVAREAPFYSDLKQKQVPVRGLRVGDRLEWRARVVTTQAESPGHFWGQQSFVTDGSVVREQSFMLRLPKTTAANVWSPQQKPAITEDDGRRVYRWTSSQLNPTVGPEATARAEAEKKRTLTADEITDRTDGKLPLIAWTNFPDWSSIGAWYRGLEGDRVTPDAAIQAKAAELIAGKTTDEEKIRAIYAYVSADIRYIGVALGMGRYQPHLSSEVMSNQYGDCKDKATLLASLLAAAGYTADTVLIGPGIRFNEAVPSPNAFNHAITAVHVGSSLVWLDATQEIAPYRALNALERDKQALRVPLEGKAALDRTPKDLPFESVQTFSANLVLTPDGGETGHLHYTMRGDDELSIRAGLRQVSPGQYDQVAGYILGAVGFNGKSTHTAFSSPTQTDQPLSMDFDYVLEKPEKWTSYTIFSQMPLDELPTVSEKEPPQMPLDLGTPRVLRAKATVKLPAGWGANLPEAVHQKSPWVQVDKTYRFENGTLYIERTIQITQQTIPVNAWRDYKKLADVVDADASRYIQLNRSTASAGDTAAGPPPPSKENAEAAKLVHDAGEANGQHELDKSAELIAKAKALNEQQAYLWSVTGALASLRGEDVEAVNDFNHELELHPNEPIVYTMLFGAALRAGKRTEAEDALRRRLKVIGSDSQTATQLALMLVEDEKAADAVTVAEEASKVDPTDIRLRWMLGRAQIKAGQRGAGSATLTAALHETTDPGLRNDIAYELADGGFATDEVEDAGRKAIEEVTTESAAWTLTAPDQNVTTLHARSQLLAASWDTLGWILYKKGKADQNAALLTEAEHYIAAAWHNNQNAEEGLHLGDLQEAQHRPAEALVTYQLAVATIPQFDASGKRIPPNAMQRDLEARIARLLEAKAGPKLADAHADLQKLRVVPLPSSKGVTPIRHMRVLLEHGTIGSVMPSKDDAAPSAEMLDALHHLPLNEWVPSDSSARLLRSATVNCKEDACEVVFIPMPTAD